MKQKTNKILTVILLTIFILLTFNHCIYADVGYDFGKGFYSKGSSTMINTDVQLGHSDAINSSNDIIARYLGIAQVIGSVISVAALAIIGIRYMFSSLEEKANMKGILIYYIVGAVLVFATSNVLSVVYRTINSLDMNREPVIESQEEEEEVKHKANEVPTVPGKKPTQEIN